MKLFNDKDSINIKIYADESKNRVCPVYGETWDYMVLGFVHSDNIQNVMNCIRFNWGEIEKNYQVDITDKYYKKNNRKLHFKELKSKDQYFTADRFVSWLLDNDSINHIKILILGINRTKMDETKFGKEKIFENIYNRFFRSAILFGIKRFYKNQNICIQKIVHEIGNQEDHSYFSFHPIRKLKDNLKFETNEIEFVGKDHRENPDANVLQFLDIILGSTTYILHVNKKNKETDKQKLVEKLLPLITRSIEQSKNVNSSYNHYNRFVCRWFPKTTIKTLNDGTQYWNSQFYSKRRIPYLETQINQLSLNL